MFAKRILLPCILGTLACFAVSIVGHAGDVKKVEKKKEVWTDASDPSLPADFKFQGEYANKAAKSSGSSAEPYSSRQRSARSNR